MVARSTLVPARPRRPARTVLAALALLLALGVLLVGVTTRGRGAPGREAAAAMDPAEGPLAGFFAGLPTGSAYLRAEGSELVIELPAIDLPPGGPDGAEAMATSPLVAIRLPANGYISGFRVEVVDADGVELPQTFLHHVNLYDPGRRELFAPIQLHIFAASKETPAVAVPKYLFGIPVAQSQLLIAKGMLANGRTEPLPGATIRLIGTFAAVNPAWPLFRAYPWVMDVLFPIGRQPGGSKAFDLPPGQSSRTWVSSPAIAGSIIAIGGHVHDHVTSLELVDSTTGELIWRGTPIQSPDGTVRTLPTTRFATWHRLGVPVTPEHRYQVTVVYQNPTDSVIPNGGMGAVAGLFVPDRGAVWPAVDPRDPDYERYLLDLFALPSGPMEITEHSHH